MEAEPKFHATKPRTKVTIKIAHKEGHDLTGRVGEIMEDRRSNGYYMVLIPNYTKAGNAISPLIHESGLSLFDDSPIEGFNLDLSAFG
jgi:hypothetical protein